MPNKDNRRAQKNPRSGDRPTKTRAGRSATVRSDEGEAMTTPAQPNATKPVPDPGGKLPSSVREPSPIASSRSLKDLAGALGLTISAALLSHLEEHAIHTVDDLRRAGGVGSLAGVSAHDTAAIRLITAHANLSVLTPDEQLRGALVAQGYTSLLDVTKAPRADFVAATHDTLGGFKAAQLYEMARAQLSFH